MFSKWCFKFHIVTIMTLRSLTHMSLTFGLIYAYGEVDILNDLKNIQLNRVLEGEFANQKKSCLSFR